MRDHLGRKGALRGALCCACALASTAVPGAGRAQSLQLGGRAGGSVEADPEAGVGAQGDAGGDVQASANAGAPAPAGPATPKRAPADTSGPTHTVVEGDTLWGVSEKYYRDPYAWPRLWSYNPQVTNPHYIYPGDVLALGAEGSGAVVVATESGGPSRRVISKRGASSVMLREQAYLDADALETAGTIMGSNASHMLLSVSDEAYVEFSEHPSAPVGREMVVFRRYTAAENSPVAADPVVYDPENPGEMVKVVGTLKVISYDHDTKVARTEVVEALDVIERGFRVADEPRRYVAVQPRTNEREVESTIVAATDPVELVGQHQLVYVGIGSEQGVQAGNRFFVYRQGDEWRAALPTHEEAMMGASRPREEFPPKEKYPEEVIGELLVLHTRPATATAIVTHSIREVVPGDRVRMPDGY